MNKKYFFSILVLVGGEFLCSVQQFVNLEALNDTKTINYVLTRIDFEVQTEQLHFGGLNIGCIDTINLHHNWQIMASVCLIWCLVNFLRQRFF